MTRGKTQAAFANLVFIHFFCFVCHFLPSFCHVFSLIRIALFLCCWHIPALSSRGCWERDRHFLKTFKITNFTQFQNATFSWHRCGWGIKCRRGYNDDDDGDDGHGDLSKCSWWRSWGRGWCRRGPPSTLGLVSIPGTVIMCASIEEDSDFEQLWTFC